MLSGLQYRALAPRHPHPHPSLSFGEKSDLPDLKSGYPSTPSPKTDLTVQQEKEKQVKENLKNNLLLGGLSSALGLGNLAVGFSVAAGTITISPVALLAGGALTLIGLCNLGAGALNYRQLKKERAATARLQQEIQAS